MVKYVGHFLRWWIQWIDKLRLAEERQNRRDENFMQGDERMQGA